MIDSVEGLAKRRICFVVSSPMTAVAFLSDHIRALSSRYDVHLIANADESEVAHPGLRSATFHRIRIQRATAPLADLQALFELVRVIRVERFSTVHSLTPKAGLLTAIAAYIARVPVRMHTYTGQVWATRHGPARWLLKQVDRLIARLDTHVTVDSASQLEFLRNARVLTRAEGEVIGPGSVSGVDSQRFKPDAVARAQVRSELAIPSSAFVFLFVGRLNRDKGVLELASAFDAFAQERGNAFLIFVGPEEEKLREQIRARCARAASRVRFVSWSDQPERYMAASDVFCLPSHREGFGAVIIEAAAAGLPAIGSRIYGVVDAIEHDRTGLLVSPASSELAAAMEELADDDALRARLGAAARDRALRQFSKESVTSAFLAFYERILRPEKPAIHPEPSGARFD
jgi:glycosyltransferase involved in cell wall biosynthesis